MGKNYFVTRSISIPKLTPLLANAGATTGVANGQPGPRCSAACAAAGVAGTAAAPGATGIQPAFLRRPSRAGGVLVACWWRAGGVLVVMVDLTMLQPVLDAADSGRNGFVTLFLADGWLLATTPRNEALFERH